MIHALAHLAGYALYSAAKNKRKAFIRLCGAFGIPDANRVAKRACQVHCLNEFEILVYPGLNRSNIGDFSSCEDLWRLDEALKQGRGVMLLFAHFGANQLIMPAIGYRGYKMSQISAPATTWADIQPGRKFSWMEKASLKLRMECELSLPVTHINLFKSIRKAYDCLKGNDILGIAIDGGGGKNRVHAGILGKTFQLSTGAMDLAMRTGCVVMPTFMIREKNGRSRMILEEPLKLHTGGDYDTDLKHNIQMFAARLDEYVRKYPCHYLNFLAWRKHMEIYGEPPFMYDTADAAAQGGALRGIGA